MFKRPQGSTAKTPSLNLIDSGAFGFSLCRDTIRLIPPRFQGRLKQSHECRFLALYALCLTHHFQSILHAHTDLYGKLQIWWGLSVIQNWFLSAMFVSKWFLISSICIFITLTWFSSVWNSQHSFPTLNENIINTVSTWAGLKALLNLFLCAGRKAHISQCCWQICLNLW